MSKETKTHAQSIPDFCKQHGFSKALFYKLMKEGKAPKTIKVGKRRLVTTDAAREWRENMQSA